jgi:long-subunit acyl-CoA synthetase (AMP-forming)
MRDLLTSFATWARREPDRIALRDGSVTTSYGSLLDSVQRVTGWATNLPQRVGMVAAKHREAVVWQLALAWAGRTVVPLPDFFSPTQLSHLVDDAGLEAVVAAPEDADRLQPLGVPCLLPVMRSETKTTPLAEPAGGAGWIIYTSGTTGKPKGVILGESQVGASVRALAAAVAAHPDDRMLSVLPYALLLEQVAGLALPLSVGASIILCPDIGALAKLAEVASATATILVPELLAAWVAELEQAGRRAPDSLRFVAVGGAPVPPRLAQRAWALGLPVHEGYGLTECCSVVAVNRPGRRRSGTVGKPLPGVAVSIDNGEIVVGGPTVMHGYLGGSKSDGVYRTGDAGHFDAEGRLVVEGRIDDIIVTSTGRNIHPGWIESMISADPRVARCAVVSGGVHPRAVLVPADPRLADLTSAEIDALVARLTADAPDYARPRANRLMTDAALAAHGLITANGRLRRRAIATHLETLS